MKSSSSGGQQYWAYSLLSSPATLYGVPFTFLAARRCLKGTTIGLDKSGKKAGDAG